MQAETNDHLRDFTATPRMLQLAAMAAVTGTMGAGAAWVLLRLIALITNLAYFGRLSAAPVSLPAHLSAWSIAIPVIGSIAIGLMARY
ncbi:MAG: chloride channel protein, partial [Rhizomicrobium sp.]